MNTRNFTPEEESVIRSHFLGLSNAFPLINQPAENVETNKLFVGHAEIRDVKSSCYQILHMLNELEQKATEQESSADQPGGITYNEYVAYLNTQNFNSINALVSTTFSFTWTETFSEHIKLSMTERVNQYLTADMDLKLKKRIPVSSLSSLTDGVILCKLSNLIKPFCVSRIHVKEPDELKESDIQHNRCWALKASKLLGCQTFHITEPEELAKESVAIGLLWQLLKRKAIADTRPQTSSEDENQRAQRAKIVKLMMESKELQRTVSKLQEEKATLEQLQKAQQAPSSTGENNERTIQLLLQKEDMRKLARQKTEELEQSTEKNESLLEQIQLLQSEKAKLTSELEEKDRTLEQRIASARQEDEQLIDTLKKSVSNLESQLEHVWVSNVQVKEALKCEQQRAQRLSRSFSNLGSISAPSSRAGTFGDTEKLTFRTKPDFDDLRGGLLRKQFNGKESLPSANAVSQVQPEEKDEGSAEVDEVEEPTTTTTKEAKPTLSRQHTWAEPSQESTPGSRSRRQDIATTRLQASRINSATCTTAFDSSTEESTPPAETTSVLAVRTVSSSEDSQNLKKQVRKLKDINESLRRRLENNFGRDEVDDYLHYGDMLSITEHLEVKHELENKIRFLEGKFGDDVNLAHALYEYISVDVMVLSSPSRVGYLTKQGGSVKSWKRRFFVLKDNFMFYYRNSRGDNTPQGVIHLVDFSVDRVPEAESKKPNCFKITNPGRTYYISADRGLEMDLWIEAVKACVPWYEAVLKASRVPERAQYSLTSMEAYSFGTGGSHSSTMLTVPVAAGPTGAGGSSSSGGGRSSISGSFFSSGSSSSPSIQVTAVGGTTTVAAAAAITAGAGDGGAAAAVGGNSEQASEKEV